MQNKQRIFLIGPMGAGKTAVGRRLARMLEYRFFDADQHIEEKTGVDVSYIFDKEGEAGFRKRERDAIDELTKLDGIVLATGGGAIVDKKNRENLGSRGLVVYLHTSVEQQYSRTRQSQNRPLLQTDDPQGQLEMLLESRGPMYEALADIRICTDRRYVKSVAREVFRRIIETADPA